jgi:hypothetical protein
MVFGIWGWACEIAKRALPKKEKSSNNIIFN